MRQRPVGQTCVLPQAFRPARQLAAAFCILLAGLSATAAPFGPARLDLPAPAARAALEVEDYGSYAVPTAPWAPGGLPALAAEGQITLEAWQVTTPAGTLELLAPLRDQLGRQGYETLFECAADGCGGFDFRYETTVLPEPEMHVDLADFRFLAAHRPGAEADFITLLVSRTSTTGYVQIARVGPGLPSAPSADLISKSPAAVAEPPAATSALSLAGELETAGRAVLGDLRFATGSAELEAGEFASLEALAAYLAAHPAAQVTLVGHTDAEGSLNANIALSRARAESVMVHLIGVHGIAADRLAADGVGYLMPLASNLSDEGRRANRRVEAVLTSTE